MIKITLNDQSTKNPFFYQRTTQTYSAPIRIFNNVIIGAARLITSPVCFVFSIVSSFFKSEENKETSTNVQIKTISCKEYTEIRKTLLLIEQDLYTLRTVSYFFDQTQTIRNLESKKNQFEDLKKQFEFVHPIVLKCSIVELDQYNSLYSELVKERNEIALSASKEIPFNIICGIQNDPQNERIVTLEGLQTSVPFYFNRDLSYGQVVLYVDGKKSENPDKVDLEHKRISDYLGNGNQQWIGVGELAVTQYLGCMLSSFIDPISVKFGDLITNLGSASYNLKPFYRTALFVHKNEQGEIQKLVVRHMIDKQLSFDLIGRKGELTEESVKYDLQFEITQDQKGNFIVSHVQYNLNPDRRPLADLESIQEGDFANESSYIISSSVSFIIQYEQSQNQQKEHDSLAAEKFLEFNANAFLKRCTSLDISELSDLDTIFAHWKSHLSFNDVKRLEEIVKRQFTLFCLIYGCVLARNELSNQKLTFHFQINQKIEFFRDLHKNILSYYADKLDSKNPLRDLSILKHHDQKAYEILLAFLTGKVDKKELQRLDQKVESIAKNLAIVEDKIFQASQQTEYVDIAQFFLSLHSNEVDSYSLCCDFMHSQTQMLSTEEEGKKRGEILLYFSAISEKPAWKKVSSTIIVKQIQSELERSSQDFLQSRIQAFNTIVATSFNLRAETTNISTEAKETKKISSQNRSISVPKIFDRDVRDGKTVLWIGGEKKERKESAEETVLSYHNELDAYLGDENAEWLPIAEVAVTQALAQGINGPFVVISKPLASQLHVYGVRSDLRANLQQCAIFAKKNPSTETVTKLTVYHLTEEFLTFRPGDAEDFALLSSKNAYKIDSCVEITKDINGNFTISQAKIDRNPKRENLDTFSSIQETDIFTDPSSVLIL